MNKYTQKEAELILYGMWENGELPSNFTEDHSNYPEALKQMMQNGYLITEELF
jgi:hypothetical protein